MKEVGIIKEDIRWIQLNIPDQNDHRVRRN
jgi:hypothetical protein